MVGSKVACDNTQEDDSKHDGSDRHMETMEPCQHEKSRTINPRAKRKIQLSVGVTKFMGLKPKKQQTQDNRCEQA